MAGLTPAPPPSTRLRATGESEWLTGDVTVDPGDGLASTQDGQQIRLSHVPTTPPALAVATFPGALAAGDTRSVRLPFTGFLAGRARVLEAHASVAPSGADASNHYVLRVSGLDGGSIDLPMISGTRYELDAADENAPIRPDTPATGAGRLKVFGAAERVVPTSTLEVSGVGFYSAAEWGSGYDRAPWRGFIGTSLAASGRLRESAATPRSRWGQFWHDFTFDTPVTLEQGSTYYLGAECVDPTDYNADHYVSDSTGALLGVSDDQGYSKGSAGSWGGHSSRVWDIRAIGDTTGVLLSGRDLTVEVVAVGTGGTTPPEDVTLTVRMDPA